MIFSKNNWFIGLYIPNMDKERCRLIALALFVLSIASVYRFGIHPMKTKRIKVEDGQ